MTRRIGETLCIGDDIKLTVLGVQGVQVRIGVEAPRSVSVDREEVRARKDAGIPHIKKDLYHDRTASGNR